MTHELLPTLLGWMEVLAPAFTKPGFGNAVIAIVGWIRTSGPRLVTEALLATDTARRRHHDMLYRFFSRGAWYVDDLGHLLMVKILKHLVPSEVTVELVVDDTLTRHKGPKICGLGNHLDAVRSTRKHRIFSFGHIWVVVSVVVWFPFSSRPWALPILFRLYRNKKDCAEGEYRKKTELARELLDLVASWFPQRRFLVTADEAYSNATVAKKMLQGMQMVGVMRPNAALTTVPGRNSRNKAGRPALRGKRLPTPRQVFDQTKRWRKFEVFIYGQKRTLSAKLVEAQWYRVTGDRKLRIVIVRTERGKVPFRTFFSTDASMTVEQIIEAYASRWSIEVCFRDLKQELGFGQSQARKREAVERVTPFIGYTYTMLVLWFATGVADTPVATPPLRPWYRHKKGMCFADILRAAQRVLGDVDVLDLMRDFEQLRKTPESPLSFNDDAKLAA